ncbi:MAG: NAD-dependent epimerase/dehydratase family protein [Gaiella sp.]
MRLLLLGGPKFLGRAVIDEALARGHDLTMFNRGQTGADLYPDVERIAGDRDGGLGALSGREWDAVIDTCGYVPRLVRDSARALGERVGHYTFVSSISVYGDTSSRLTEQTPVGRLEDPTVETMGESYEHYGPLKALCEEAAEAAMPGRVLSLRAGLIVGPHDGTGRFTYWPHRVARGGRMVVPEPIERRVEFIDVRDVAAFALTGAETGAAGPTNVTAPWTLLDVVEVSARVSGAEIEAVQVSEAVLADAGVGEWMELPLWIDSRNPESAGFMDCDCSRALAAGLTVRPLEETVRGTLELAACVDGVGLSSEREAELLRI